MSTFDAEANAAEWNSRYSESDRMWSGNPNGALVDIAKQIAPGRALDVGCGEGADAVWLASHGWQVTAIDPSSVALERARAHGANTSVAWINSGIQEFAARERAESFDLVSAMYPVIEAPDPDTGVEYLTELVAPGGHLLFVHHVVDPEHLRQHPEFAHVLSVDAVRDYLTAHADEWSVEVAEDRARTVTSSRGAGHSTDRVILARRGQKI